MRLPRRAALVLVRGHAEEEDTTIRYHATKASDGDDKNTPAERLDTLGRGPALVLVLAVVVVVGGPHKYCILQNDTLPLHMLVG